MIYGYGKPPLPFGAIRRAADKVVYSTTLDVARSARTRIERRFDPDAVRAMKDTAERDLTIGGPRLAGEALRHGLVDECHVFINPVVVGGGTAWLPASLRLRLASGPRRAAVWGKPPPTG